MCLHIDEQFHPNRKAFIADRPLLVYKVLHKTMNTSPCRYKRYEFGVSNKVPHFSYDYDGDVEQGLHAYTSLHAAQCSYWKTYSNRTIVRPAIIPAGARVWLGYSDEICATELIVYRNGKELRDAYGVSKYALPMTKSQIAGIHPRG